MKFVNLLLKDFLLLKYIVYLNYINNINEIQVKSIFILKLSNLIQFPINKNNKDNKMIIVIILISALFAIFIWNHLDSYEDIEIDQSNVINYDVKNIKDISSSDIINFIENSEKKRHPVLIYLYTSWCGICQKQLPVINKIAQKFQNTDLQIMAVAIDKDLNLDRIKNHLNRLDNLYFPPFFISNRGNFTESLKTKSINFRNRIPFTILIDKNSKIIKQSSGYKSFKYFNKRIIKLLSKKDES